MKKIITLLLSLIMLFSLCACCITDKEVETISTTVADKVEAVVDEKIVEVPTIPDEYADLINAIEAEDYDAAEAFIDALRPTPDVEDFLTGNWQMLNDEGVPDDKVITISFQNGYGAAIVTDISDIEDNEYYWAVGDVKWNNIKFINNNQFIYENVCRYNSKSYAPVWQYATGTIDFEEETITIWYTTSAVNQTEAIWVKVG